MKRHAEGFSLIELMIAMTVTLIVSGAIYGLLTSGSNAFRREPEVADRQQNIRLAMDLITRDVFGAGTALPPFSQAFTIQDASGEGTCTSGLNGCGVAGSLGATAESNRSDTSSDTDVLQILAADETCPIQQLCSSPGSGAAGLYVTVQPIPACLPLPGLVMVTDKTSFVVQRAQDVTSGLSDCPLATGGGNNGNLQLFASFGAWAPAAPILDPGTAPVFLYGARVVRYRIAPSGDPQDTSPALWRSTTGVYGTDGLVKAEPGDPGFTLGGGTTWQLVARGIEDLQVEYLSGTVWLNAPSPVVDQDYSTLVRRVRVTLSARVTAGNLQGESRAGGTGPDAVRGQLVTEVAPRAVLTSLQIGFQQTGYK